jgi:hypothetical protein
MRVFGAFRLASFAPSRFPHTKAICNLMEGTLLLWPGRVSRISLGQCEKETG